MKLVSQWLQPRGNSLFARGLLLIMLEFVLSLVLLKFQADVVLLSGTFPSQNHSWIFVTIYLEVGTFLGSWDQNA